MQTFRARIGCWLFPALLVVFARPAFCEDLSGGAWRLWRDEQAAWKDDRIFLPGEVKLDQLPVNPPTGGWQTLDDSAGVPVTLPCTVEEHFWGATTRPYTTGEYRSANDDHDFANGNYLGVSWWWRTFTAPVVAPGQRLIVHIRGARLRSEVYCNGKLCGYSIMTELPFDADVTAAVHPGVNQLAVRITNPGGRLDWRDSQSFKWGNYELPSSLGFGGLDAGIEMETVNDVAVRDLAVLNHPDLKQVDLSAAVENTAASDFGGTVRFTIARDGATVWTGTVPAKLKAGQRRDVSTTATVDNAEPWDLDHPNLYRASAELDGKDHSARETDFGFRFFTATGIGDDAKLTLNGKRIVVKSSISWGFWAPSGLWPNDETADREVAAVKAFGLNCIQSHRNLSKPIVLDRFDRAGLLRYEEPGSGKFALGNRSPYSSRTAQKDVANIDTSGNGGEPQSFAEKYEEQKLLAMVRRDRSHPSLIIYCIQNEIGIDLHEPRIYHLLRAMRAIDPSRIALLKSGIPAANQAYMLPWDETVHHDDGTGFSGWSDQHTVGGPGTYMDSLYKSPDDFSHRSTNRKEIVMWGEMLGSGTPDDHQRIVDHYRATSTSGYDRADHETILAAYDRFLDQYGFRSAFPTSSALFQAVGYRSYFMWQKMIENCRISDAVDYFCVSGWESTTLENHSGLLDAHRNFKADPAVIHQATEPFMLVVRPRHLVLSRGDQAIVDVHVVNEVNQRGKRRLNVNAIAPDGSQVFSANDTVELTGGDVFGQLLHAGHTFPMPVEGVAKVTATLTPIDGNELPISRVSELEVIDPRGPGALPARVVVLSGDAIVSDALKESLGVTPLPASALDEQQPLDAVVVAINSLSNQQINAAPADGSDDPALYQVQTTSTGGVVAAWRGLREGPCKVELFLSEPSKDQPAQRLFDIALNGKTVATDLDPFVEAGGRNRAVVKTFTTDTDNGAVVLSVPNIRRGPAIFAAARLTDSAGRIVRTVFRADPYTDPSGDTWAAFRAQDEGLPQPQLDAALRRVSEDGTRLICWPDRATDSKAFAQALAARKILNFEGTVGTSRAAWMGSWYFVRQHPLFAGLPTDCAMDWRYQIPRTSSGDEDGLLLDAPRMEVIAGYGRDHDPHVGIAACAVPYGKGRIIIYCMPALKRALKGDANAPAKPVALRMLANALR